MAERSRVTLQVDLENMQLAQKMEQHTIECPVIGAVKVYMQGTRTQHEVIILTVHDLGCDHTMYMEFVEHPKMAAIRNKTVWVHVEVPGQGQDAEDLPAEYVFPSMQQIGEDLVHILDHLKIKEVICFGEGAGANILARFAMSNISRVLGVCFLHATGSTAGLFASLKDKVMSWKLDSIGMNPNSESYLVLHRFGAFSKANDKEELKAIVESYQETLRNKANAKNLKKFVEAFLKRSSIADNTKKLQCPVLLVTGQQSIFNTTTRQLHQAILKTCEDKAKIEFIEVGGVANVLEEKPDKLVECFQYFLQGLGLVSSVPMQNVVPQQRGRSMSMQDYDIPLRQRMNSAQLSCSPPVNASPRSSVDNHGGVLLEEGSIPASPADTPSAPENQFTPQQPLLSSN